MLHLDNKFFFGYQVPMAATDDHSVQIGKNEADGSLVALRLKKELQTNCSQIRQHEPL
jgi:hypothetical protein